MESQSSTSPTQEAPQTPTEVAKTIEPSFSLNVTLPTRDTAPFIYDLTTRTLKGAAIGLTVGLVFFKGAKTRRFCTYYGAGFGLGLSYPQVRYLYGRLIGEKEDDAQERMQDLQKELELR